MRYKIKVEFSDEDLRSILVSAIEGGVSRGWAAFWCYDPDKGVAFVCEHNDTSDRSKWGPWRKVSIKTIRLGLERCAALEQNEGGWAFGAYMRDRIGDASTADCFLQLGLLGELKYG